MTGEITLRGRILPIGGLKEKLLAAIRHNIKKVLIPYDNKKDLEDIESDIISKIDIKTVKFVDEVLSEALEDRTTPILEVSSDIQRPIKNDIISSNPSSH